MTVCASKGKRLWLNCNGCAAAVFDLLCLACWIQFLSTGIIRYGGLFEDLVDALKLLKSLKSTTSQRDHTSRIGKKNENTKKQKNTPYSAFETEYGVLFADQTLSDRCAFRII